jgi:L-ascorbate metabolism protein UlaG (beta-lactamase superfamily)
VSDPALTVTLVGGPTTVLEYAGVRLLTDPTFDPPGRFGTGGGPELRKTEGPALAAEAVGDVDAVLLSHDQHPDNLDVSGREYLSRVDRVLTTTAGAERLGGSAEGMEPWAQATLPRPGGGDVTIIAVPAQHGPVGTEHLTGTVIGFVLRADGLPDVYVSGDNASVAVVEAIVARLGAPELAVLHIGGASLPDVFGEALLTLGADDAVAVAQALGARAIVPVHQQGWEHFSVTPGEVRTAFAAAGLADRLVPLEPGGTVSV